VRRPHRRPPPNQATTLESQLIHEIQYLPGRTHTQRPWQSENDIVVAGFVLEIYDNYLAKVLSHFALYARLYAPAPDDDRP
jgi:hypothetical protein